MADTILYNPATGGSGPVSVDKLTQALSDGLKPTVPIRMWNPATGGEGDVTPERAHTALSDGLLPVGSREHKVATTSQTESGIRGAIQGGTLGFGDEIGGAVKGAYDALTTPEKLGDAYRRERDSIRDNDAIAQEANPKTYLGSQVAGGIASAFVPGLGAAKGASLLARLGSGAALGAANGIGASNSEDLSGLAKDALTGGALGTAGTGVAEGVGAAGKSILAKLGSSLDPEHNLALAFGLKSRGMDPIRGKAAQEAVSHLDSKGFLPKTGNTEELYGLIKHAKDEHGQLIGEHVKMADADAPMLAPQVNKPLFDYGKVKEIAEAPERDLPALVTKDGQVIDTPVSSQKTLMAQTTEADPKTASLLEIIRKAPHAERPKLLNSLNDVAQDLQDAQGSVSKLNDLRKTLGDQIGPKWTKDQNPAQIKLNQALYGKIREHINDIADTLQAAKPSKYSSLRDLNKNYSSLETVDDFLAHKLGDEYAHASPLGVKSRTMASALAGAIATGHPGMALPVAALQSAASSTRGQLGMAALGKAIGPSLPGIGEGIAPAMQAGVNAALPAATQAIAAPPDPQAVYAHLATLPIQERAKAASAYNKNGQVPQALLPPPKPQGPPNLSQIAQRMRKQPFGMSP